ncbi:nocturnin-like isoform X3 [Sphaeramia orbicularis]|uniref:nocturnin-like isoform X1 n=1 Tax=Sphaeramia orbicularis TaxID=375764 RepID=UPI00117F5DF8|nr:nocturnin-like isoform X1 [Sphaeramia orbicularis]XP_030001360.1 nocturnin-like isoform X3 [Sphaeramia orbicularis]
MQYSVSHYTFLPSILFCRDGSNGQLSRDKTVECCCLYPSFTLFCPMGSSSSRLFGTLAQPLNSAPLAKQHLFPEVNTDQDLDQDELTEVDPDQLLRECEEILQRRPARPHRDLVYLSHAAPAHLQHNPTIRVMQWNILAQALGEGKDGFIRCPLDALNWQERKYLILEEILTYRPDILCLQEVDHYYDTFQPIMSGLGYHGSFLAKPWSPCLDVEQNNGPDGCALFYRRSRFSLQATAHLRLSAMMLPTNQVAIVQTLTCRATGRQLCVAVTHLKARSGWERLRSAQGTDLLHSLRTITSQTAGGQNQVVSALPLVVCGDFNAEPSEDVYRRFRSSPLGLDSAYKLLSSDGQTEPPYTTWKIRPSGESCSTLDYIWYTQNALSVECLLDLPTEDQIGPDRLPSYHYPSDHLSLLCDISFRDEPHRLM